MHIISLHRGDIDLRGFEMARSQFFSSRDRICVSMNCKCMSFSSLVVSKFPGISEVELLIHPVEKMFAVRESSTGVRTMWHGAGKRKER